MKQLHINIQPKRAPELDVALTAKRLCCLGDTTGLAKRVSVNEGACADGTPYFNVDYTTPDLAKLWSRLRSDVQADVALSRCSIIVCEGSAGWDDYLLLHHFNPSQPLDELG